jgi:hypothetical protein
MKWVLLIFIGVMCYGGFVQHTHNEQSIKETTKELLEESGYGSIGVNGINLPISYTFLSEKVISEVFITKNGEHKSIDVVVTPIESFPIISIFSPPSYQISIDPLNSLSLGDLMKRLFE